MTNSFSNILIPVDFSINTQIAVQKALWLSVKGTTVIHLLHVTNAAAQAGGFYVHGFIMPVPVTTSANKTLSECRLEKIRRGMLDSISNIEVNIHVVRNNPVQDSIIQTANRLQADLIIIGKNRNHNWFPFLKTVNANTISTKTKCAVLTVKPGGISNKMKSVVIPVGTKTPERKIELLGAFSGNNRPTVHLVTIFKKNDQDKWSGAFLETYRTLSQYLHYPVEYEILTGNNPAKAIYDYAKSVRADMVILNPNEESKINTISGMQTNDLVIPDSKLNVLTT